MKQVDGYEFLLQCNVTYLISMFPDIIYQLYHLEGVKNLTVVSKTFLNFEVKDCEKVVLEVLTEFGNYRSDEFDGDAILFRSEDKRVLDIVYEVCKAYDEGGMK